MFWRRRRTDADFAEEIESHIEFEKDRLISEGMSPDKAAAEARRLFGNTTLSRERFYESRRIPLWDSLKQDVQYAFRMFRKQSGFAVVAIVVLTAAIGINDSVFTVFSAVALRPWAVRDPGRVVSLRRIVAHVPEGVKNKTMMFSIAEARFLDANSRTFEGLVASRQALIRIESGERSTALAVKGNYF